MSEYAREKQLKKKHEYYKILYAQGFWGICIILFNHALIVADYRYKNTCKFAIFHIQYIELSYAFVKLSEKTHPGR